MTTKHTELRDKIEDIVKMSFSTQVNFDEYSREDYPIMIDKLLALIDKHYVAKDEVVRARETKDYAYWERNQLVGVLSRLYPSHLAKHIDSDKIWENSWRNIVCVHTPAGQATWHVHDSDMPMFSHLKVDKDHWDGHTTEEKYDRIAQLQSNITKGGK